MAAVWQQVLAVDASFGRSISAGAASCCGRMPRLGTPQRCVGST
ncbi:WDR13 isoform 10 [Pan troglodytes]|uniref:WD repeat domain 13 n=3 Tax=Hominidae TaxID=9604 RepID=A0A087X2H9_HUMAN|nr:WDR13 isoform 7 [Pan troglodytes]PNI12848.1 WDR13 isoform 10 [Pan troglodytes]PNJ04881.1 WDR13 isoform 7 [Pongo abelii]PNJ04882.1 WDR13 isoform 10 [Pongo abelii]